MRIINAILGAVAIAAAGLINGCATTGSLHAPAAASAAKAQADTASQKALRTWIASCYTADTIVKAGTAYAQTHGLNASQAKNFIAAVQGVSIACVTPPAFELSGSVTQNVQSATAIIAAIAGVQVPSIQGN
jgi:hypothetical protein